MIDDNKRDNDVEEIFFEEDGGLQNGDNRSFFEEEHHQGHYHNTAQRNGSDGNFFASMVDDALGAKKRNKPQKDKRKSRKGGGLGLVLTLAALGAGGYFWATSDKQTVEKIVQDVTAKLEEQGAMDKLRTLKNNLALPEMEDKEQRGDAQEKDDYLPFEDVASTEQVDQERIKQPEQNVVSENEAGASNAESDGAVTEQFPLAEKEGNVAEDSADLVLPGEQENQKKTDKQNTVSEDKDSERDIEHLLKAQAENYEKALSALKAEIESYRSELSSLKEMMSKLKNSNALQDGHPKQDVKVQEIYEELDKINIKLSQLGNVEKKVTDLSKHLEDIEKSTKHLATRKHVDHKLNIYDKKIKRWVSKRFVKKAEEHSVAHVKKQAHSAKQTAEHVASKKQVKTTKPSAPKGIHVKKYGDNNVIVIGNDVQTEGVPSFRGHAEIISLDPYKKEAVIIVDNGKIIEVKEGKYEPLLKAKILKVSEGGIVTTRGLISR